MVMCTTIVRIVKTRLYLIALACLLSLGIVNSQAFATIKTVSPNPPPSSMNYTGPAVADLNPQDMPVCPPPTPEQSISAGSIPPLLDPNVPHCKVIPVNANLHLSGINENSFLQLDPNTLIALQADNPVTLIHHPIVTPAVSDTSSCFSQSRLSDALTCQNGVGLTDNVGIGQLNGVAASLDAQTPTLYGSADVYNWIGVQNLSNGGNLDQMGIDYNNLSNTASADCSGNNDVNNRPIISGEMASDGGYSNPICFPAYILGPGSQTFFDIYWSNNWWGNWVYWNGTWEDFWGANIPDLYPSNALADFIPAEVIMIGPQYVDPNLPNISDANGQFFDGSTNSWVWWEPPFDTAYKQEGPYCLDVPTEWTNVTVSNGLSCPWQP